jgi:urease accessory protein
MPIKRLATLFVFFFAASLSLATAHPGHDGPHSSGLLAGLAHPWTGLDHLLAFAAVGLWASLQRTKGRWLTPPSLLIGLLIGGLFSWFSVNLPLVEPMILSSVLIFGLLIASGKKLPAWFAIPLVGGFALFHGYAHVHEMPFQANALAYFAGFLVSSSLLSIGGFFMGSALAGMNHNARPLQVAGAAVAITGLVLITSTLF